MRNGVGLLLLSFPFFVAGQSLLQLLPQIDRSTFKGCSQTDVDSCIPAEIDLNLLQSGDTIELPDGTKLMLSRRGLNSAVFKVWFRIDYNYRKCIKLYFIRMTVQRQYLSGMVSMLLAMLVLKENHGCSRVVVKNAFFGSNRQMIGWMK